MRLIFLTGAGGRAQSAARFPCGVLTMIPRIESRTFRWMVPTVLVPPVPSAFPRFRWRASYRARRALALSRRHRELRRAERMILLARYPAAVTL